MLSIVTVKMLRGSKDEKSYPLFQSFLWESRSEKAKGLIGMYGGFLFIGNSLEYFIHHGYNPNDDL